MERPGAHRAGADRAGLRPGWGVREGRGSGFAPWALSAVLSARRGAGGGCAMGNRTAADADALLAGRGPGAGGGAGTPGAAAALAGGVLLIGAVLAGNSLVCVSVAAERSLQTPTNYFIVSLAAADLLLALLVLPLFVYSEVSPRPPPRAPLSCSFIPCPTSPQGQRAPATWLLRNLKLGGCRGAAPGLRTTGASVSPNSTPPHLTVHLSALLSVCTPSSVPLLSAPSLSWRLLPKRCLYPSRHRPQKQATLTVQPPPHPLSWVLIPRGASWTDRQIQAKPPWLPLGQRDTCHCSRPPGTPVHPREGDPHSRTDSTHSWRDASCQELRGSEHGWREGWPRPDCGTEGRGGWSEGRSQSQEPPPPNQVWPFGGSPLVPALSAPRFGSRKAA